MHTNKAEEKSGHPGEGIEITYKLHGNEAIRRIEDFIALRVEPIKEKYPYAKIRIEVRG